MNHFNTTKGVRGFTILEMMIVAVVIVILAMVLVPVLKGAKDRAKQVQCMSNLHGLYVLWSQKRGEDSYIMSPGAAGTRLRDTEWPAGYLGFLQSLGGDTNIFVCPADPKPFRSPVVLVTQHTGGAGTGARIQSQALEEPCVEYPWDKTIKDVPNPRRIVRKAGGAWSWNTWDILINSNNTATLTLVSGGFANNDGMAALWDQTRTNRIASVNPGTMETKYNGSNAYGTGETNWFGLNGAQYIVPTMAVSYGINYVDLTTYTNSCSSLYEGYVRANGWPDDATRTILFVDYPISHVHCATCYGYYKWANVPAVDSICCYCGTNNITPKTTKPGPADNWDADAMGPLIGRHKGRCNVVFQDGSASTYKPADIDPRANMWQIKFNIVGTTTNRVTNRLWRSILGEGKGWDYPSGPF
jgi:prepilin-type N-terminal cleavage/methylation domain-containing protein/prepilin-type processing-associated H-X9-DG protein